MTYKLFIDDERFPTDETFTIARSSKEAIELLQLHGLPQEIAFDHDLGEDDTSMRYINALVDFLDTTNTKLDGAFKFSVHSQNPVGAENIRSLMNNVIYHFS